MRNKKGITPDQQAQLDALRYQVKRCEDKGLTDTAHHEMLARLEKSLGLIPAGKIEDKKDEVINGKQNL